MTLSLVELAKRGDAAAIASILTEALRAYPMTISVDRDEKRLIVGLYGVGLLDQTTLVAAVHRELQSLEFEFIRAVRIFGYGTGDFVPHWSQRIRLDEAFPDPSTTPIATSTDQPSPSPETHHPDTRHLDTPDLISTDENPAANVDYFIVCGLGSLGQYCAVNLKKFATEEADIHITAIDKTVPEDWEVDELPELLAGHLVIGNGCRDDVLLQAGIQRCRAILIVTSDESCNIETAIAARRLNPTIRLVVRSARSNLNQLLKQQLGNLVALEPTELPAPTFALAGLGEGILGLFNINFRKDNTELTYRLRVVEQDVQPQDYRFDGFPAYKLHRRSHRLMTFSSATSHPADDSPVVPISATRSFYQWHPETRVQAGDRIAYVELVEAPSTTPATEPDPPEKPSQRLRQMLNAVVSGQWWNKVNEFGQWVRSQRTRQIISIGLVTGLGLWIVGTLLLRVNVPGISWKKAMSSAVILLLGGYGDVFGGLDNDPVPGWVQFICLLITSISLLFVLGVLGLIADSLLSSRFDFFTRRPPIPKTNHIVLVGFGRVGQQVASLLQSFNEPVVAIIEQLEAVRFMRHMPLLVGDPIRELNKANLPTARSIIVVTEDQMVNLEAALIARDAALRINREIGLVIRTYDQRFSNNLMKLLPDAKAFCAYELSAEAFAGAAFGENMLSLFRLNHQTILVAEYNITDGDTLADKLLAQVAYGYGVVPIFYQRGGQSMLMGDTAEVFMPLDDVRLHAGDRLIVLASINGLRRIERGELTPPGRWHLQAGKPLNSSFSHYSGNDLARISGCGLDQARAFMENLPSTMELLLYDYQAHRLLQELSKQLTVTLTPIR